MDPETQDEITGEMLRISRSELMLAQSESWLVSFVVVVLGCVLLSTGDAGNFPHRFYVM